QALNARGTQFVCFIHWGLKNLFLPRRKCREVMRITINQSLLIARAGHDPVQATGDSINKFLIMY
ncbi:hypothetical protein M5650_020735, partial [Klebsiella pneumoniae]